MKKIISAALIVSALASSNFAFASFSLQESECLAQTVAIETKYMRVTNSEIKAIAEMYVNQSRAEGYPDTLCGILKVRANKPWSKEFAERLFAQWPFAKERFIRIAREVTTFYDMRTSQPITGGALEYNMTGIPPKSNMFPTVTTGRFTFYSTYKW